MPTDLSAGSARPLLRAAFYGRSNVPRLDRAGHIVSRQYQTCRFACSGRAELVRYFYDIPKSIGQSDLHRIPPFPHDPPEYHGGWQDLAEILPKGERDFDVVVCQSLDRISRRLGELQERRDLLACHGVSLVSAEGGWQEITPALWELVSGGGQTRHAGELP